ncbi:RpiB/LacA/LacB family sugar-phosphate isomerase [Amycolatopsis sp. lyj-112]|uniref:RpiB/LacA/LacB family sugar-phosphate isomerase n=1 Tax=Amycolatopsis sp. lyj-112 TaxID=2789288 RepID=UPI00397AF617
MKIAFASDDRNATTDAVRAFLAEAGHDALSPATSDAWPEIGAAVGKAVADGEADFGVVMCWTGTGTAIAANKVPGVRAALAWDAWIAEGARKWNDANVLALSLKRLSPDVAVEITATFLSGIAPDPEESVNIARLGELDEPRR